MHKRATLEPVRRRGSPGQMELRRLRAGIFRLGSYLGLDTQAVVRFSESISGQRWRRCGSAELESVVAEFSQIAGRIVWRRQSTNAAPVQRRLADEKGRSG